MIMKQNLEDVLLFSPSPAKFALHIRMYHGIRKRKRNGRGPVAPRLPIHYSQASPDIMQPSANYARWVSTSKCASASVNVRMNIGYNSCGWIRRAVTLPPNCSSHACEGRSRSHAAREAFLIVNAATQSLFLRLLILTICPTNSLKELFHPSLAIGPWRISLPIFNLTSFNAAAVEEWQMIVH